jgi:hypothetical protein
MNLGTWFSIRRILLIKGTKALQRFGVANSAYGGCFAMLLGRKFGWMSCFAKLAKKPADKARWTREMSSSLQRSVPVRV